MCSRHKTFSHTTRSRTHNKSTVAFVGSVRNGERKREGRDTVSHTEEDGRESIRVKRIEEESERRARGGEEGRGKERRGEERRGEANKGGAPRCSYDDQVERR